MMSALRLFRVLVKMTCNLICWKPPSGLMGTSCMLRPLSSILYLSGYTGHMIPQTSSFTVSLRIAIDLPGSII